MANSYQKNILRTFKGSKSRFIAIFAIVALGVGFLAGLLSTTPDMEDSMEEYLDGGNLFDLRVVSTLGLTEDDVAALEQVEGVAKAQGGKSADLLVEQDGSELVCRVHALPADPEGEDVINRLTLADGRWPENANECVVEAGVDTLNRSYDIGDTLTLDPDNENLSDTMNETTFTVVGVVHDTYYFSFEREPASVGSGAVQVILYVPDAAFATDYYTEAYLTVEGAAGLHSFDDEYSALVDTVADRVEAIDEVRCQARYDEVVGEAQAEIDDGWQEYYDGKAEADQELADARAELEDAQADLDAIEMPSWYVWDRDNNVSYNSFAGNVTKVEALAGVFPLFFFLVAALVVSTTMTRMIEEERLQIGTMKALGYANGAIMRKYVLYAMTAAVLGALFGLAFGFTVFPSVIWYAYAMMYYVPAFHPVWRWGYALFAGGSLILCTLAVTIATCRSSLKESPADLMRPRAPKAGKRILLERIRPLWRRLSFTYKVTCRNLFRYKRRFWMTVIGVAGCTALLVTGFGISDSINGIMVKQYTDVSQYDLMTAVTDAADTRSGPVYDYLFAGGSDGAVTSSLATMTEAATQELPDGSTAEVYLMVPQDAAALNDYIDMHERTSRQPTPLGETGVVLTEKLAELLDVKAGDTVTLVNGDGAEGSFTVSGVCENYVSNYVYMSAATYADAFGQEPEWNNILSRLSDDSQQARDAISTELLAMDEVASLTFTEDMMTQVLNMLNSINAVVVMIVVCAAVLALVVLYNLTNINVAERVKEIATIKVLGFYDREVSAYVMRETVALTIIGALFGLAGGIALHRFVIYTVEVDAVMFGRTIDPSSFVYSLALTMLFSLIVNLLMGRKLKHISMVESMKAPE